MIGWALDQAALRDRPRAYLQLVVIYAIAYVHLRLMGCALWLIVASYAGPSAALELALVVRRRRAISTIPRAVARRRG